MPYRIALEKSPQKTLMIDGAYFAWWAMTTLAPKTLWMIWILSALRTFGSESSAR